MTGGVKVTGEGLSCRRGDRLLFCGLSFEAAPGSLSAVTGPNGSGKTSLLRMIAGLLKPEAGTLRVAEAGRDEVAADLLHYLGHHDALKSQMTARENLVFAARWFGAGRAPGDALERLGLSRQADLPVGYFSAGQRKRTALARCWMLGRPLWLLDEPTAALDAAGRALVIELIAAHAAGGGTVIAATHEPLGAGAAEIAVA
ncbi:MAG: heme ABC exporter ATP-binding protein CcmA [Micropepsaceae bacterium]